MKKILLLLILTTLIGCGFKPIYSSKESDFKIIKIETDQNLLNRKFAKKLKSSSNEKSNNRISVKFNIKKEKLIKVKNKKNIPTIFELKINLILTITDQENNERTEELTVRTKYNNKDDKFELSRYEKKLEDTAMNQLFLDVIDFLSINR